MAITSYCLLHLMWIVDVLGTQYSISGLEPRNHFSTFCETETFNATCPSDHVVLITHARYGRMQLSRCVKMDYGHIGCSTDVLAAADARCSGRRKCEIRVPDPEFAKNKPCPDDLKPYLEAGFTCIRVQTPPASCTTGQQSTSGVVVTSSTGYLSSVVTDLTGCGRSKSPWILNVERGQTIQLSLFDFGLHARAKSRPTHSVTVSPPPCVLYAVLRDGLAAETTQNVSVCGGTHRQSVIYTSTSNRLEVTIATGDHSNQQHFLLHFTAVGCPDLPVVSNSWPAVRHGDGAIIRCNFTKQVYHLKCNGNMWFGDMANCSSRMSVAIVLVLAFTIGLLVLTFGLLLIRRRHRLCLSDDRDDVTLRSASIRQHSHHMTGRHQTDLYDSLTSGHHVNASKYCVAKTLLLSDFSDCVDVTPRSTVHRQQRACATTTPSAHTNSNTENSSVTSPVHNSTYSLMRHSNPALPQPHQCLPNDVSGSMTSQTVDLTARPLCSCYAVVGRATPRGSNDCVVCQQQQHQLSYCHPLLGQESREDDVHTLLERRTESVTVPTAINDRIRRLNVVPSSELIRTTSVDQERQRNETVSVA